MNYDALASPEQVARTTDALRAKGVQVFVVDTGAEALTKIKGLIPVGASVMNGASRTLEQIGYVEYLKSGSHGWNNLKAAILAETDPTQQQILRKQAVLSDFYLGSVHALAENGEFVVGSNTGSQLPHIVFTSPNLIFVVSTKKIVPTMADAMRRLEDYVVPLEDQNIRAKYNIGTMLSKVLIFKGENPRSTRKITVILVNENLGF